MNKPSAYIFSLLLIFSFIGCKEIPPIIDFSAKAIGLKDDTYITASIPASVNKMIFIEDITGVRCPNCPNAALKIDEIADANPQKVVAVGVYPIALVSFMAPYDGFEALITTEADAIFSQIFNSPSELPTGGINRKIFPGETIVNNSYKKWSGYADIIKTEESPVIINNKIVDYDPNSLRVKINVKTLFSKKYDEQVNLTIYVIENKIISQQQMPDGVPNPNYEHNHVLRKSITPFNGFPLKINSLTKGNYEAGRIEAGRIFEKEFEIELDPKWKKENCAFVVLVNRFDTDSKEVLQVAELHLP